MKKKKKIGVSAATVLLLSTTCLSPAYGETIADVPASTTNVSTASVGETPAKKTVDISCWQTDLRTPGVIVLTGLNTVPAKEVVIPTLADFQAADPQQYSGFHEVQLTREAATEAMRYANYQKGTVSISENGPDKVVAQGENWSKVFGGYEAYHEEQYPNVTSLDLHRLDTHNITDMTCMFGGAKGLITLNVSGWDTSQVRSFDGVFYECNNVQALDMSSWQTDQVRTLDGMFQNCFQLQTLDVGHWNISQVRNINGIFYGCTNLQSVDVSNWDTSQVTNFDNVFSNCKSLKRIDVSQWNTSNGTHFGATFYGCEQLEQLDVSNWDTSKNITLFITFADAPQLQLLDLISWDATKVVNFYESTGYSNGIFRINEDCSSKEVPLLVRTKDSRLKNYRAYQQSGYQADRRSKFGLVQAGEHGTFHDSSKEQALFDYTTEHAFDEQLVPDQLALRATELQPTSSEYVFAGWQAQGNYSTLLEQVAGTYVAQWKKK
ncbi:BspA family leucine-rich repeat surface protein, partial [Enterococcus faecium]|nr:BspA family leucine-rich repeat surface protein [Enterococcus faecium]